MSKSYTHPDNFVRRHIGPAPADINVMLKELGYTDLSSFSKAIVPQSILNDSLNIELSVAVKPDILEAKYRWYQDWPSWIEEDLVDYCVIMNYYTNLNKYNSINTIISNQINKKHKINIGISSYNQSSNEIANKILISRLDGFSNFSLFPYSFIKDTSNWYNPIYKTMNFHIEE